MTARIRKHCGGLNCEDSRSPNDNSCECPCDGCSRCACGCLEPARQGFDRIDDGVFKGRGAGYSLIRRRRGWQVLDPEGKTVSFSEHQASLDIANQVASKHAKGTGHGHP